MGAYDYQFGFKNEVTFGTALTVDRFAEYEDTPVPIVPKPGRTESNPLRVGSRVRRQSRNVNYLDHVEGTIQMVVMDKGFGFWLTHMLPNIVTAGAGPYTHTATEGATSLSIGKSFTCQLNAPFSPTGTNQAITFSGCKVPKFTLSNTTDEMLMASLDIWGASSTTATALATAAYPSTMTPLSWAGGVVSIGGSAVDIDNISIELDHGYQLDRKQIRGNTAPKEPTPGQLGITFSIDCDFESLTQYNRVQAITVAGAQAAIVGTWTSGTSSLAVTIPAGRFDDFAFSGDPGSLKQTLTGIGEYDGTLSPMTIVYTTSDATP